MARPTELSDPADDRLAPYRHLRDATLRSRVEDGPGVFVVEGHLALEQLVVSSYEVVSVLITPNRLRPLATLLARLDAPVYVVTRAVMASTVGFDLHRGVVAVGRRPSATDPQSLLGPGEPLLVLEGVNDHENLGALFRNARAFGVGGVLLDPTCADPLYRRSVRVSVGHVLHVPFARLDPWPAGLSALRAAGYRMIALTPDPAGVPIEAVARRPEGAAVGDDRSGEAAPGEAPGEVARSVWDVSRRSRHLGRRWALLVGAEGPGLSAVARVGADVEVRIPMAAGVDSLNVATAAAIALHRLGRPDLG